MREMLLIYSFKSPKSPKNQEKPSNPENGEAAVFEEEKTFRRRRYILTSPKVPSQTPIDQHLKVSVQRVLGNVGIYQRRLRSNIRRRTYIPPSPKVPSQTIVDHHLNVPVSKAFGRRMLFPSSPKIY